MANKSRVSRFTLDVVDDFPPARRPTAGNHGQRKNDIDVALEEYLNGGANGVLKFLDFNVDAEGNPVDEELARQRATGRVAGIKQRGYTADAGWAIAARDGSLYAKFYGPGNVPAEFSRKRRVVGEDAVDETNAAVGERVPAMAGTPSN